MNHGGGEPPLASLIEHSAELKRALVDLALSPRFERHLEQFMLEATDPYQELSEEREPRPGISVIGARLSELVRR